jgi:hypothetical protein
MEEQEDAKLILRISEKLRELGFTKQGEGLKGKVGRRRKGKYPPMPLGLKDRTLEVAIKSWEVAKEKHEEAKEREKK